jgi:hypothetical protein
MKKGQPRRSTAISIVVDREKSGLLKDRLNGDCPFLRWHQCACEVEHDLRGGSEGTEGSSV